MKAMVIPTTERDALRLLMEQTEADLKSAHAEICKAQGIDPADHDWPAWTTQANTLRWIASMREKFGIHETVHQ